MNLIYTVLLSPPIAAGGESEDDERTDSVGHCDHRACIHSHRVRTHGHLQLTLPSVFLIDIIC